MKSGCTTFLRLLLNFLLNLPRRCQAIIAFYSAATTVFQNRKKILQGKKKEKEEKKRSWISGSQHVDGKQIGTWCIIKAPSCRGNWRRVTNPNQIVMFFSLTHWPKYMPTCVHLSDSQIHFRVLCTENRSVDAFFRPRFDFIFCC